MDKYKEEQTVFLIGCKTTNNLRLVAGYLAILFIDLHNFERNANILTLLKVKLYKNRPIFGGRRSYYSLFIRFYINGNNTNAFVTISAIARGIGIVEKYEINEKIGKTH